MNAGAIRAGVAVFLLGVVVVWLIAPIRNACPDVGLLPPGSTSSSAPSFSPPLTRMCTYTTPDGTKARKRYVPIVDWLILAVIAGVVGAGIGLLGPAARSDYERDPPPSRPDSG
ncbi:MAG TPA: hypothetical protein VHZ75_06890 [Solirubrobacteraceae bacterium]|jgi:hypothetical protein|nr:hypothetical protein [Solirubrobacteraceae bacterium]